MLTIDQMKILLKTYFGPVINGIIVTSYYDTLWKERKKILSSMKCPICQKQIEGITILRCARDGRHYEGQASQDTEPFEIHSEFVHAIDNGYLYIVSQYYKRKSGIPKTYIDQYKVDPENRVDHNSNKHSIFDKIFFDFQNINKEKLLNRIKTILVFQ